METNGKIMQLRQEIKSKLAPLIGNKVILTDCPYYSNIGDILIWQGEVEFLKSIDSEILSQTSFYTFNYPKIDSDVTICLQGGGNFGDLYRICQDFRKDIILKYPNNRIIIFPQSVWYTNTDLMKKDALSFSSHPDLYICARDLHSYRILNQYFGKNKILLVPDLAFYLDLSKYHIIPSNLNKKLWKKLYFKRLDKEYIDSDVDFLKSIKDVADWPTFEQPKSIFIRFESLLYYMHRFHIPKFVYAIFADKLMRSYFKPKLISEGVNLLNKYDLIYVTRLHAMILGVLMSKNIVVLDNTTGKLSSFYDTWFTDLDKVEIVR